MDAIVTAGGIPQPGEPLYELTQGKSKALLEICGKPMIQWVVDALCQAHMIDRILVMGLEADSGLQCAKLAAYLPNQGSMLENIRVGVNRVLELNPQAKHVLVVSSDIPTITESMVDWVVETTMQTDLDVYYNVITRQVMEARFPGSNRTYTKLKGLEICGGDMNVIRTMLVTANDDLWMRLIAARKSVVKQAAIIGWDTLFLMLFRQLDLDGAIKRVTQRVHLTGKAILCPYAEVGMDVDKPHQLDIVRTDLEKRLVTPIV